MDFRDLVLKNRSYRRFDASHAIDETTLRELVDLARQTASGANLQPLRYICSCSSETNAMIFPHLAWAGYLKDWSGPTPNERPSAYIVILEDTDVAMADHGDQCIAAQTILLAATERGLGGCMIGSIQRQALSRKLNIDPRYRILLAVALGKPAEQVVLEDMNQAEGSIEYYRDENDVHHVPKRRLDDIIFPI